MEMNQQEHQKRTQKELRTINTEEEKIPYQWEIMHNQKIYIVQDIVQMLDEDNMEKKIYSQRKIKLQQDTQTKTTSLIK